MEKICSECGSELDFQNSFVLKGRDVCRNCLHKYLGTSPQEADVYSRNSTLSAKSFNRCGTTYYGNWEIEHDGRCKTIRTLWVTFCCIPIIPIASAIIWNQQSTGGFNIIFAQRDKSSFSAIRLKLFWPQILTAYSIISIVISALIGINMSATSISGHSTFFVVAPIICIFPALIYIIKYWNLGRTNRWIALANVLLNILMFATVLYFSI